MNIKPARRTSSVTSGFMVGFHLIQTLTAVLALVAVSCAGTDSDSGSNRDQPGKSGSWPVARVVDNLEFEFISFYPSLEADWRDLIVLRVFDGFWPGMTGDDAVREVGAPDERYELSGEDYWVYHRGGASVIVAHKDKGSIPFLRWWRLEARFNPPAPPENLLHRSIVQELPQGLRRFTVVIMNNQQSPAAWVYFENGRIVSLDLAPAAKPS